MASTFLFSYIETTYNLETYINGKYLVFYLIQNIVHRAQRQCRAHIFCLGHSEIYTLTVSLQKVCPAKINVFSTEIGENGSSPLVLCCLRLTRSDKI